MDYISSKIVEEFKLKPFQVENAIKLIDEGVIMYDIRIGSYSSGRNYGKAHDHGSGFRILEKNIHLLYENHERV